MQPTKVNIMYVSYWSLNEPLTASTILPYMKLLEDDDNIGSVIFVTIEHSQEGIRPVLDKLTKLKHHPIRFSKYPAGPLQKARLFLKLPKILSKLVRENNVHVVDSKASVAGILAYKVSKKTGVPFIVESFEPHSRYMLYSGVWGRWTPYFQYNIYYEKKQIESAKYLVTVTQNYREHLIEQGVSPDRVIVVPSITQMEKFRIDAELRTARREQEGIPADAVVGIYVGKFGGLYLEKEAFELLSLARKRFGASFHLIILTPQEPKYIQDSLIAKGFSKDKMTITLSDHKDVPSYLAASDIAFSPIKYMAMSAYQSPVKNGEYWAAGLPIVLTDNISDDHWIMKKHGIGGALFDVDKNNMELALEKVQEEMKDPDHKVKIRELALKYRSISIAREVYLNIFNPKNYE